MWRNTLGTEGGDLLSRTLDVQAQLETHPSCAERFSIAVYEDPLIGLSWCTLQESTKKSRGLWPEGTKPFLSAFSKQPDLCRWIEAKRTGINAQCFLNASTRVVKERQQGVVTLAFERGTIRLRQDGSDFVLIQVTEFALSSTFYRNAEHFFTLARRQWLPIDQEAKKAAQSGKPAVPRSDGHLALLLAIS
jgi:hypothetical protein